jgi:2-keto-3-deoxy-L-rhamnonate aldolase RhmA
VTRVGTVIALPGAVLAELAGAPLDLAWIDLEHGALTPADVPAVAVGLRAAGCEAHVRLPSWRSEALGPVLDAGVDGVVVPAIETAGEAAAVVRAMRHPPAGARGYGPRRAGGYGRRAPGAAALTVQIESPRGVENAEAIAAVDGVDALVVGCSDLGLALGGAPGDLAAPRLAGAVARVATAAAAAGAAFGVAGGGAPQALAALAPAGAAPAVLVHSTDVRLYARAIDAMAAAARAGAERAGARTAR